MFNENENVLENVQICAHCGEVITSGDAHEFADNVYCDDCFNELFDVCERCGDVVPRCDLQDVNVDGEYEQWCGCCVDWNAHTCDYCGELVSNDSAEYIRNSCEWVCPDCLNENFFQCAECGEYFHNDYANESRRHYGEYVCDDCYEDEVTSKVIHEYHDGPRPLNWGTRKDYNSIYDLRRQVLFVGVELELADGGEDDDCAREIVEATGHYIDQSLICEHDGSLHNGFELISTTADVDYHINDYGWRAAMAKAVELGYTSHDAGCCGMHVHMDRRYFVDSFANPEMKAALILVNNAEWFQTFSRRKDFGYCRFPSMYMEEHEVEKFTTQKFEQDKSSGLDYEVRRLEKVTNHMSGHGRALNFDGSATMEVRFNRGTLKFSTFVATLQFVQMYADAIKFCPTFEQACQIDLAWFIKQAQKRGYEEFLNYLDERGISLD